MMNNGIRKDFYIHTRHEKLLTFAESEKNEKEKKYSCVIAKIFFSVFIVLHAEMQDVNGLIV